MISGEVSEHSFEREPEWKIYLCDNCEREAKKFVCEKKMPKMRKSGRVTKKKMKLFIYFLNRTEK